MTATRVTLLAISMALISGCGPGSGTTSSPQQPTAAKAADADLSSTPPDKKQGAGIWFEPSALSACGRPEKLTVYWDARSYQGVKTIDIYVVNMEKTERLFLSAGRAGSRESGAWMRVGSKMIMRDKATGAELAHATVGNIPCE